MKSILGNTRKADIVFHPSGRIDITSRVAKSLDLQHGDIIDIMFGEGEWYLYIKHHAPTVGRHEGMAFRTNTKGRHYRASSKTLCTEILRISNRSEKVKLCCGQPVTMPIYGAALPIIINKIIT